MVFKYHFYHFCAISGILFFNLITPTSLNEFYHLIVERNDPDGFKCLKSAEFYIAILSLCLGSVKYYHSNALYLIFSKLLFPFNFLNSNSSLILGRNLGYSFLSFLAKFHH